MLQQQRASLMRKQIGRVRRRLRTPGSARPLPCPTARIPLPRPPQTRGVCSSQAHYIHHPRGSVERELCNGAVHRGAGQSRHRVSSFSSR